MKSRKPNFLHCTGAVDLCSYSAARNTGYPEIFHSFRNFRRECIYRVVHLANKCPLDNVSSSFSSVNCPFSAIYTDKLISTRKINEDGKKERKKNNERNVLVKSGC